LEVEWFQLAQKYEIQALEDKLTNWFLLSVNSWYDVNAAVELFSFAQRMPSKSKDLKFSYLGVHISSTQNNLYI